MSHSQSEVPSLETRPKAEARSVEDLVDEARRGRIRIPAFQRDLKWEPDDALLLFDSIYRGYPIGTLLFWQTRADAGQVEFGPLIVDAEARPDAWWVVDGQQRLTSLVRVLLASVHAYSVWFDLDEERFVHEAAAKRDALRFVPLTEALDTERLHHWVGERSLSTERRAVAYRLNKRIREYSVPAYIVETKNEQVLRTIFERTNATGKRLKQSDIFNALHGARSPSEPSNLKAMSRSLADLRFGTIDELVLLRALLAIHGFDPVGNLPPSIPEAAHARTARAVRAAVVFVMAHAGIPHFELMPYKQPLVALARFFDMHPTPSARTRDLLTRWLWRGAWTGLHSADAPSTRDAVHAVDDDEDATAQRLLATLAPVHPSTLSNLSKYNFRHARTKMEILALDSLGPQHLVTGKPVGVAGPSDVTALVPGETIGTRLLHPRVPHLRRAAAKAARTVRATHAISAAANQALLDDDLDAFAKLRGLDVLALLTRFVALKARYDQDNDRPPLRALRVSDEAE